MRDTLKVKILANSNTTRPGKPEAPDEYLACRVWQGDGPPILVFLIYRPPTVPFLPPKDAPNNVHVRQSNLIADLRKLCPEYSHKVVMWDLNSDLSSKGSEAEFLRDLIDELSLKVVNQGSPTTSETLTLGLT